MPQTLCLVLEAAVVSEVHVVRSLDAQLARQRFSYNANWCPMRPVQNCDVQEWKQNGIAANSGCDAAQRAADELGALEDNAHETVVGLDPEAHGNFEYLKHFEAMQVKLQILNAEADKLGRASANISANKVDVAEVAREEHVRRIVLDVQDVMKRLTKENKAALDKVMQRMQFLSTRCQTGRGS